MRTYHRQPSGTVSRARQLHRDATDAERVLWLALRENFPAARFRRQVPIGPYYADFLSFRAKLVIEVDGGQHDLQTEYDAARTRFIEAQGYRVIRLWNSDVLPDPEGVVNEISLCLEAGKE
ncbi:endonuclease domain-containing protein [Blastomonas fulva]|uniref:endonuclease domain-containing protein n=1 Tax=Blastomonas fulva TaxID=1550728 RepID=UPI003F720FCF